MTPTNRPHPDPKAEARALLGRIAGFRACAAATLDGLVEGAQLRTYGKGEVVARRGKPFAQMALLVRGSLEVCLLREDGHRHLISFLRPGDVLGIISIVDGLGHVNDVSAREADTRMLLVPGDVVRHWRRLDPGLAEAIALQLAYRSRLLYERLAADPSLPLVARLARLLQMLSQLHGLPRAGGSKVDLKISQADLADWLGVSRQSVNGAISQLEADAIVRLRYSEITVIDAQALAARAQV